MHAGIDKCLPCVLAVCCSCARCRVVCCVHPLRCRCGVQLCTDWSFGSNGSAQPCERAQVRNLRERAFLRVCSSSSVRVCETMTAERERRPTATTIDNTVDPSKTFAGADQRTVSITKTPPSRHHHHRRDHHTRDYAMAHMHTHTLLCSGFSVVAAVVDVVRV